MAWVSDRVSASFHKMRRGGTSLLTIAFFLSVAPAQAEPLQSAVRIPDIAASRVNKQAFSCPKRTRALTDMSGMFGFYKPDKTMSVVDKKKMSAYTKKIWPIKVVKEGLSELVVQATITTEERFEIRRCILAQTTLWAEKGALLSGLADNAALGHRQAVLEIIWTSIAFANAYAVADQIAPVEPLIKKKIDGWFAQLTQEIMAEFTPRARDKKDLWLDAHANHWLWAGASVGSMAVHTQDKNAFDWSMNILKTALDEAPADGTLPRELKRGQRSLHYQNFAMAAIVIMASMADRNGVALSAEQEAKLRALATFSADAFEDPAIIQEMTGKKQEKRSSMISWAAALAPHFKTTDPALNIRLSALARHTGMSHGNACALVCVATYLAEDQKQ